MIHYHSKKEYFLVDLIKNVERRCCVKMGSTCYAYDNIIDNLNKYSSNIDSYIEFLQKILREPLKLFKDPNYSFLSLKVLKEPDMVILVESVRNNYDIYKVSKDSCKILKNGTLERTEEFQLFHKVLKNL